jgi:chorismate-pyruvate lyase
MHRYYGRPQDKAAHLPFRCDGYVAQGEIRDGRGGVLQLQDLPPFLRALLVTDGTVTKILEAYFWEPVAVDTLEQRFESAAAPLPWIEVETGDCCMIRDARLRGAHSGRAYAEAFSVIRTELIPADFRRRLIDREIGIGALIRDSGLESYREVLDAGLEPAPAPGALADRAGSPGAESLEGSVFRTYRIVIDRRPVILITECFPLPLYRQDRAGSAPASA